MSNFIALALLAVLIAIPAVAVARVYRDELEPVREAFAKLAAFVSRRPALVYDDAEDRSSRV